MRSRPGAPEAGLPSVVLSLVLETVDNLFEREFCRPPDQALLALARSEGVGHLVVADPWRSRPVDVVRRRPLRDSAAVDIAGRSVTRVRPRRLARRHPTDVRALEKHFADYSRRVGRLAGLSTRSRAALVTYDPFVAAFAEADWIERLVYVGQDDFAAAQRKRPWWPAYDEAYRRIAQRSDAVFAVSQELCERVAPGRARVLANGIDAALWAPREPETPRPAPPVDGPYAVYAGSVEGRVDETLFEEVLRAVPHVVVAGPCFDEEQRLRMEAMPGVVLLGSLRQRDLVDVISGAAVGIIPHRDTDMTRAMSPMKMYEYLAGGLPVVATDLPPMADGGDRVRLCRVREDWYPAVSAAVADGVQDAAARRRVIDQVSWTSRFAPLLAAVGVEEPQQRRA